MELMDKKKALRNEVDSSGMRWPFERCASSVCRGRRITVGYSVSDEAWDAVMDGKETCVCLTCFDEEAQKRGVRYTVLETHPVVWSEASYVPDFF